MTTITLATALRAYAVGLYRLDASVALLIDSGAFLHRRDFTGRFICQLTGTGDDRTAMAAIDWDAAITSLNAGELPCSGGERRILMLTVGLWIGMADARLLPRHRAASISIYRYRILEPMHMDGLYGTIQPFARQRLRRRWPGARNAEFSGCL
jgi:hypothetical protein